jgi:hypothetical protein
MKKTTAILFAALLAIVPLSAQATAERPTISISSYEEWIKAGVDNGWVVNSQIVQRNLEQPTPTVESVITEEVKRVPEKSLVIIDAYFDSSKIDGKVVNVCVTTGCDLTPSPQSGFSSAANHGTAMAELARKASPNATLILVRSAPATKNSRTGVVTLEPINGNTFLSALNWVNTNPGNISAVSFSYNLTGNKKCSLSTSGGVNVRVVEPQIKSTVISLKSKNIPVFASTGNDSNRKPVSYPACIEEVVSVSTAIGGSIYSIGNYDASTDYFGSLPENKFNYNSKIYGLIPQTTSSATATLAALWPFVTNNKFVNVLE